MKKLSMFVAVAALVVTFASCKKDYTCTCTYTDTSGLVLPAVSTTIHDTKKNAQTACNKTTTSGTTTMTCAIK